MEVEKKRGEKVKFRNYEQGQLWLIPPDLETEIAENDICRVINDVVDELEMGVLESRYAEVGNVAYHPRLMIKVLFYSYYNGIFSTRKIARECERNIYYWYLSGKQKPDFRTLWRFLNRHQSDLESIFSQIVQLCDALGLISLNWVALDGSKIRANKRDEDPAHSRQIAKKMFRLQQQTDDKESQAAEQGNQSDDQCPKHLQDPEGRKKLIQSKIQALSNLSSRSLKKGQTDTDARRMKCKRQFLPAYNTQLAVDGDHQIIVSAKVGTEPVDYDYLPGQVRQLYNCLNRYPKYVLADAGYCSTPNAQFLAQSGITGIIADRAIKHIHKTRQGEALTHGDVFSKEQFKYDVQSDTYRCPQGQVLVHEGTYKHTQHNKTVFKRIYSNYLACQACPKRLQCTKRANGRLIYRREDELYLDRQKAIIRSDFGYRLYKHRMRIVEPVFANIKWNRLFNRFLVKNKSRANAQFLILCCVHNIHKIFQLTRLSTLSCSLNSLFHLFYTSCQSVFFSFFPLPLTSR